MPPCQTDLDALMTPPALKILIVEDNDDLREGLLAYFEGHGHHVRGASLAAELLDESGDFTPDIYVIDLNLPDADGLDLVNTLRKVHPNVGIVITTARTQIGDKVVGYERGADIYFSKPVAPAELLAGVCALAKRLKPQSGQANALYFRQEGRVLQGADGSVTLSHIESVLLAGLVRAAGQPLARWQLSELMGTGEDLLSAATIEMRIARLRKKMASVGAGPSAIQAVYNRGYVLTSTVYL